MKKAFKIGSLVLLLLIIALVALPFIYKEKINGIIKQQANKQLTATLDFKSFDLGIIRSFPNFLFTINNLSIVGQKQFASDTLITAEKLYLKLDLMSVIKGDKYDVKTLELEGARINALALKDGSANWDIVKPSTGPAAPSDSSQSKFNLQLQKLSITRCNIIYTDESSGISAVANNLSHTLSGDFTQDNFTMLTNTTIDQLNVKYGNITYLNAVKSNWKASMAVDLKRMKFEFKENTLTLNDLPITFSGFVEMPGEAIGMDLKFDVKKNKFKSFLSLVPGVYTANFKDLQSAGSLSFSGFAKGIMLGETLPSFGLVLNVNNGMFKYPKLPSAVSNVDLLLNISNPDGVADHTIINIEKLHADLGKNPISAKMIMKTPVSDPDVDAMLKGNIDLASVSNFLPLEKGSSLVGQVNADITMKGKISSIESKKYENFYAAGTINVSALRYLARDIPSGGINVAALKLIFNPKNVSMPNLVAKIGKSDFQMNGSFDNLIPYLFKAKVLSGNLNLTSKLLDLNQLMAASTATTTTNTADTAKIKAFDVPANLDFNMLASVNKVLYEDLDLNHVSGKISIKNQTITLSNVQLSTLDGSIAMNGFYNSSIKKEPKIDFDLNIKNFNISKTVKTFSSIEKLAAVAKYCSGNFSTNMKVNGRLNEAMEPVVLSLTGLGALSSSLIEIKNFEPLSKLAEALKIDKYKTLTLNDLSMLFTFDNGRVNVKPFEIKIGKSKVNIFGSNGFDKTIDYTLKFEIPKTELGAAANGVVNNLLAQANAKGANLSVAENIKIDALLEGTISKPKVKLAYNGMGAGALIDDLKAKAKEEFDKKKAELEARARQEADKLKNQALQQKAEMEAKAKAEIEARKKEAEDRARAEADKLRKQAEEEAKKKGSDALKGLFNKPK